MEWGFLRNGGREEEASRFGGAGQSSLRDFSFRLFAPGTPLRCVPG
jgi:hypothetical protein